MQKFVFINFIESRVLRTTENLTEYSVVNYFGITITKTTKDDKSPHEQELKSSTAPLLRKLKITNIVTRLRPC